MDESITLSWPENEFSGLILNTELCDGRAYMFGPGVKSVQIADLASRRVDGRIGRPGNGPTDLRRPVSIAIDCRHHTLYCVEGPGGILSFDLNTGAYLTTYTHPPEFKASTGSRISISGDGARLLVPGLWPTQRASYDQQPAGRMFTNVNLGMDLRLTGDRVTPIGAAYEPGCAADSTACLRVDIEPIGEDGGWIVSHGGATRIAVLSAARELVRHIDVRSPAFLRDGSSPGKTTPAQMKWGETNSSIRGVYVFGDVIAVVHARHATKDWQRGQTIQFEVFMNLYGTDGRRLVSDIRLPDLPVGRDESHVLVMDYGAAGRRSKASQLRLLKIRVRPGTDGFSSAP